MSLSKDAFFFLLLIFVQVVVFVIFPCLFVIWKLRRQRVQLQANGPSVRARLATKLVSTLTIIRVPEEVGIRGDQTADDIVLDVGDKAELGVTMQEADVGNPSSCPTEHSTARPQASQNNEQGRSIDMGQTPPQEHVPSIKVKLADWLEDPCPICLEEWRAREAVVVLPCGHKFHRFCIVQWLASQELGAEKCPQCMQLIRAQDGQVKQSQTPAPQS